MSEGSSPIPNLADGHEEYMKARHILFVLPGTDIEVSLARSERSEKHPNMTSKDFMVYFRHTGKGYPNLGYIHIDTVKGEASYEVGELKL